MIDHLRNMLLKSELDLGAVPLPVAFAPSPSALPASFSLTAAGLTNFIGCNFAAAWPLLVLLVERTRGVKASWDLFT